MVLAAKLVLEYGYPLKAVALVERVLIYKDLQVELLRQVAVRMKDSSQLEELSCAAKKILGPEGRDKLDVRIVDCMLDQAE